MNTVILNAGGGKFETRRSTLADAFSDYFKQLEKNNKGTEIFIDCDPICFKHVLEHLRFYNYKIPSEYKYVASEFMLGENSFKPKNK